MSVITHFSVYSHCNDLGGKLWNPAIRWTHKYAVFVVLQTDSGVCGLGECWCFDTKPDSLVSYLKTEIAPQVLGSQIDELVTLYQQLLSRATLTARHGILASAWAGVDIAAWDIKSRKANLPLWQCLKNEYVNIEAPTAQRVNLYGSGGLYAQGKSTDDLVAEMQSIRSKGFNLVKMKVGGLTIDQDVERALAVLNAIGDRCRLIIDGVYSYTTTDALILYRALPISRIEAFQSPVSASDSSAMRLLCEAGVPVMGTEAEYRYEILQEMISTNAVKYLQVAPVAVGGISRVIELAGSIQKENSDIKLSMEVSSTAVALLAACHVSLFCSLVEHVEYHFIHQVHFNEVGVTAAQLMTANSEILNSVGLGVCLGDLSVNPEFSLYH